MRRLRSRKHACRRRWRLPPAALRELSAPAGNTPTHEQIATLAYAYWEARGCQDGSAEQDWLRAERALRGLGVPAPTAG